MPCYLFTEEGFRRRDEVGVLPPNRALANIYRAQALADVVYFTSDKQATLIEELLVASEKQSFRQHYAATEPTHLHALVSWNHPATWKKMRGSIRASISRRLNRMFGRREWLSEGASARRVIDDIHFRHSYDVYLPGIEVDDGVRRRDGYRHVESADEGLAK